MAIFGNIKKKFNEEEGCAIAYFFNIFHMRERGFQHAMFRWRRFGRYSYVYRPFTIYTSNGNIAYFGDSEKL